MFEPRPGSAAGGFEVIDMAWKSTQRQQAEGNWSGVRRASHRGFQADASLIDGREKGGFRFLTV